MFRVLLWSFRTLLMTACASLFFLVAIIVLLSEPPSGGLKGLKQHFAGVLIAAGPGVVILYVEYVAWRDRLNRRPPKNNDEWPQDA